MAASVVTENPSPTVPRPGIPKTPDGFTPGWVAAALAAGGAARCTVAQVRVTRIGEGVGIMAELYRLDLEYSAPGQGPASVIAKLHAQDEDVRALCAGYGFYEREVCFYRDVAPTLEVGAARAYFAAFDPATGDAVIVMENLAPAESPNQIEGISLDRLIVAIDAAASLHAAWWQAPALKGMRRVFPALDEPPYSHMAEHHRSALPAALVGLEGMGLHGVARVATLMGDSLGRLQSELSVEPVTLCHGDYRTDNLMFLERGGVLELGLVDWQIMMQARGVYDIGYLMGGGVATEMRRAEEQSLLRRYHDRLTALGVTGYSFEDCFSDYRRAVLVGVTYWAQAYAVADLANERAMGLFRSWADRLAAVIEDLGLEALAR